MYIAYRSNSINTAKQIGIKLYLKNAYAQNFGNFTSHLRENDSMKTPTEIYFVGVIASGFLDYLPAQSR